jgi:hypothetical protein
MPETGNKRVLDTAKTLLLPAELYCPGAEAEFLRFNGMELADGEVAVVSEVSDVGASGRIVAVMGVAAGVAAGAGVGENEGVGGVGGVPSPLLGLVEAAAGAAASGAKRSVNIHLTAKNCYLVVWEKGLQMAEVLPDTSLDSLLYYMQVVGRSFKLRRFEIRVGGVRAGVVADALRGYFGSVRVV